jgi:TetR/AcrR family transcriptional regulator
LRIAQTQSGLQSDAEAQANLMVCFVAGRWQQFAKTGFKRKPSEFIQQQINMLLNAH